jgi:pectinesterase
VNISPMRAFITIEGAGADKTVVQWGDTAETVGSFGRPLGTFGSATFAVNSAFFVAKNITFKVGLDRSIDRQMHLLIL